MFSLRLYWTELKYFNILLSLQVLWGREDIEHWTYLGKFLIYCLTYRKEWNLISLRSKIIF